MGFGQVFTMLSFLLIFAFMAVYVVGVQQAFGEAATEIKAQTAAVASQGDQEITITDTDYAGTYQERDWITTYNDEFEEGSLDDNAIIESDALTMRTDSSAIYNSSIYDTGKSSNYTTISWTTTAPGTATQSIRSANTTAELLTAPFLGPGGTDAAPDKYYAQGSINETHNGDRYIQFQTRLVTGSPGIPRVEDISIGIQRPSGHARLELENTGKTKLRFEEIDVYIDGVRVPRTDAYRVIHDKQIISNERLWDPGERVNVTVFTDIAPSTSKTITVTNGYAKDQAAVTG